MSSDLSCMVRGEFRCDQYMVLLPTAHIRNAGTAKPNAKTRCTGDEKKMKEVNSSKWNDVRNADITPNRNYMRSIADIPKLCAMWLS